MKQIQKLDNLIVKILKEELGEEKKFVTPDGTSRTLSGPQKQQISKIRSGETIDIVKQGNIDGQKEASEEEQKKEVLDNEPKASDIAGKVSEILDQLKTMSEGGKDPKKQKLAARAMKQMESAKIALEALTAHEVTLEQKEEEGNQKNAQKHVAKFKKALTKLVKEPAAVEKISAKMTPEKMALLIKKMKGNELEEEKLARVMLQHSLKEGWIK